MPLHQVLLDLGYVGAALGVVMVVPQILRTVRHPTLGGVSPVAWSMTVLGCSTWLTYGLRTHTMQQIPGNVLLVAGAVAVVLLVPSRPPARRRALTLGAVAAIVQSAAATLPAHAGGLLGGVHRAGVGVAAGLRLVATWRAGVRSGVSLTTWSLKAVSQICWLIYAITAAMCRSS